jgi:hypothetical protein
MSTVTSDTVPLDYIVYKITIMRRALFAMIAFCLAAMFFSRGLAAGIVVGGLISIANFSLLAKYIIAMRGFSVAKAKQYIIGKFLVQYVIMAAALFIAATKGMDVFIGTAVGLLMVKVSLFLEMVVARYAQSR